MSSPAAARGRAACAIADLYGVAAAGPLPAEWLEVKRATSNSVSVRWRGPAAGAVGSFALRYRTQEPPHAAWAPLPPFPPSQNYAEVLLAHFFLH